MPRSGWALKVGDRKKALLVATPLRGVLRVSLTVRESEREILLGEPGLADVREELLASRKYVEGFALRFDISDEAEGRRVEALLSRIITLRTRRRPGEPPSTIGRLGLRRPDPMVSKYPMIQNSPIDGSAVSAPRRRRERQGTGT